jgi:signal transduction histidine kinase
VAASLFFTNHLTGKLAIEEQKKMEIWADAMHRFNSISLYDTINFELIWNIIENNEIIPVIIADIQGNVINYVNINKIPKDTTLFISKKINDFKKNNEPIELNISENEKQFIYYDNSLLLKQLGYFPYIQLSIIAIFLLICFWAFSAEKKAEQNRVWVGLSKETAHQLGTPISSLLVWETILKEQNVDNKIIEEIGKDIERLNTIADRFSKVGSLPVLTDENIVSVIEHSILYLKKRTSQKVEFELVKPLQEVNVKINAPLFEWVIENLCKNAVDAMQGCGKISFYFYQNKKNMIIDIIDTGKGIDKKHFNDVFKPGYTTKQRGWGLGLSLAKRIIEVYHKGNIFVKSSELGKGTTFRISLVINKKK